MVKFFTTSVIVTYIPTKMSRRILGWGNSCCLTAAVIFDSFTIA